MAATTIAMPRRCATEARNSEAGTAAGPRAMGWCEWECCIEVRDEIRWRIPL